MPFKSILTVLTSDRQTTQLQAAIELARDQDAHLEVFCLGVDHTQTGYYYAGASAYVFQESIDRAMADAAALEATVRQRLEGEPLRWSVESAVAQIGGVSSLIGMRARFADLTVLIKPYGDDRPADAEAVVEAAMFEGGCPVLIIPDTGLPSDFARRILVGWNESNEALCAVRRALPLLVQAEAVEIAVVAPSPRISEGSDPGAAIGKWLTRHGAKAQVSVLAKTMPRISEVLNRHARETGATMLVMGAYGHSRFREAILGGATRNMLENAEIPVFMAR